MRQDPLSTGEVYHVFNKSIAEFKIFNNELEFIRLREVIHYYQKENPSVKFSRYCIMEGRDTSSMDVLITDKSKLIDIIAYCLMPTHFHLVVKQLIENGISIFMRRILDSYTRYFNLKHNRKGPLWEGRFKSILVKSDEQLLHLTRYIHLNPVTAYLVNKPEEWMLSSYQEYLLESEENKRICDYAEILDINPIDYKKFVEDRSGYQRELNKIKKLLIE